MSSNESTAVTAQHPGKERLDQTNLPGRPVVGYEQNMDINLLGQPRWPLTKTILAFVGLSLVVYMVCAAETVYNQILAELRREFDTKIFSQWMGASFLLTCTIVQPIWVVLTERFSRTWLLLISILIFMAFSVMIAMSHSMIVMCVGRALQGVGGAGMMPLASVVLTDILTPGQRSFYMGIFGAVIILGKWTGPIIGAALLEKSSWRWTGFMNLPIGAVALSILYYTLRDIPKPSGQIARTLRDFDYIGTMFWLGGSLMILLALTWGGNEHPWGSALIICPFVLGVVAMLLFLFIEGRYTRWPILPLSVLVQPRTLLTLLASFFIGLCMYGTITFVPVYYLMLEAERPLSAAKHILWCALGGCVGAVIAGYLVNIRGRVYYREWSVLGTALMSVGYILMYTWPRSSTATFRHAGYQVLVGLGLGFSMEQVRLASQAGLPVRKISAVTTLIDYARTLGGMIGLAIGGIIMREKMFTTVHQLSPTLFGLESLKSLDAVRLESLAPLLGTLPLQLSERIYKGIVEDLHLVFVVNVPFALLACIICLLLSNIPLHATLPAGSIDKASDNMEGLRRREFNSM